jgi:hypothetical protein
MAQPGMKPLGSILPNQTVVIRSDGTPDKDIVETKNGNVIAFQTKPDETKQWVLQFMDVDRTTVPYPLTVFVPEKGGITYLVVDWDSPTETTLLYTIEAFPANLAGRRLHPDDGMHSIKIGSTPARK